MLSRILALLKRFTAIFLGRLTPQRGDSATLDEHPSFARRRSSFSRKIARISGWRYDRVLWQDTRTHEGIS
jgi:hypothetical protein